MTKKRKEIWESQLEASTNWQVSKENETVIHGAYTFITKQSSREIAEERRKISNSLEFRGDRMDVSIHRDGPRRWSLSPTIIRSRQQIMHPRCEERTRTNRGVSMLCGDINATFYNYYVDPYIFTLINTSHRHIYNCWKIKWISNRWSIDYSPSTIVVRVADSLFSPRFFEVKGLLSS